MKTITVVAHGSLCDFIASPGRRKLGEDRAQLTLPFTSRQLAKDAIESVGIPHVEVDFLSADGSSVGFDFVLREGVVLEAHPMGDPTTEDLPSAVRPPPLNELRFLVDENSARLASYLRILGFDSTDNRAWDDAELARRSASEGRLLLTRDIGLLKRSVVTHGYWLRSDQPREQLLEVVRRYDLWPSRAPFSRCPTCNGMLRSLPKEDARAHVATQTHAIFDEFYRCQQCEKVYWKGSHFERMQTWIGELAELTDRET